MKIFVFAALALLAACASTSRAEINKQRAADRCPSYGQTPEQRSACVRTELALLEAADREADAERVREERAIENSQAILEAQGIPREAVR